MTGQLESSAAIDSKMVKSVGVASAAYAKMAAADAQKSGVLTLELVKKYCLAVKRTNAIFYKQICDLAVKDEKSAFNQAISELHRQGTGEKTVEVLGEMLGRLSYSKQEKDALIDIILSLASERNLYHALEHFEANKTLKNTKKHKRFIIVWDTLNLIRSKMIQQADGKVTVKKGTRLKLSFAKPFDLAKKIHNPPVSAFYSLEERCVAIDEKEYALRLQEQFDSIQMLDLKKEYKVLDDQVYDAILAKMKVKKDSNQKLFVISSLFPSEKCKKLLAAIPLEEKKKDLRYLERLDNRVDFVLSVLSKYEKALLEKELKISKSSLPEEKGMIFERIQDYCFAIKRANADFCDKFVAKLKNKKNKIIKNLEGGTDKVLISSEEIKYNFFGLVAKLLIAVKKDKEGVIDTVLAFKSEQEFFDKIKTLRVERKEKAKISSKKDEEYKLKFIQQVMEGMEKKPTLDKVEIFADKASLKLSFTDLLNAVKRKKKVSDGVFPLLEKECAKIDELHKENYGSQFDSKGEAQGERLDYIWYLQALFHAIQESRKHKTAKDVDAEIFNVFQRKLSGKHSCADLFDFKLFPSKLLKSQVKEMSLEEKRKITTPPRPLKLKLREAMKLLKEMHQKKELKEKQLQARAAEAKKKGGRDPELTAFISGLSIKRDAELGTTPLPSSAVSDSKGQPVSGAASGQGLSAPVTPSRDGMFRTAQSGGNQQVSLSSRDLSPSSEAELTGVCRIM